MGLVLSHEEILLLSSFMQLNNSLLLLVSALLLAYSTLVWSMCDCASGDAGCMDKCSKWSNLDPLHPAAVYLFH